ncbi:MAG: hypothetical protein ACR2PS_05220, partial [Pseudomonadales bacterium]
MPRVDVIQVADQCPHIQLCRRLSRAGTPEFGWMTRSMSPLPVFFNIESMGYEEAFRQAVKARAKRQ